ncbi:I66 family serine proteinase inhibitor [Kitasatospora aureofaciens]|uniref:I66 family serine proteinase inhibitor n=1 Tax=Kitasatospora aureofaciens TaxID=1894 RepID=UPI0037C7B634
MSERHLRRMSLFTQSGDLKPRRPASFRSQAYNCLAQVVIYESWVVTMGLESGYYTIQNGNDAVGRRRIEDLSMRPKAVINQAPSGLESPWVVEAVSDDRYILRTRGARVTSEGDKLVALIFNTSQADEWQLVPVNGMNRTYRVVAPNGAAWVVREPGKECQVEVLSSVPAGGSNEFTFTPVSDD